VYRSGSGHGQVGHGHGHGHGKNLVNTYGGLPGVSPTGLPCKLRFAPKSYEVDVVLDLNGNGTCEAPPADVVLTGAVPAFVNGIAELDLVYDGSSNGACGNFMLP